MAKKTAPLTAYKATFKAAKRRIRDLEARLAYAEALLRKSGVYLCEHGRVIDAFDGCPRCERDET